MKNFIITNGIICDPKSTYHKQQLNIAIKAGKIHAIAKKINEDWPEIDVAGAWVFPGWIDTLSYCGAPGNEQDETYNTLAETAIAGGYTKIATAFANGNATYTAAQVQAHINEIQKQKIPILVLANITTHGDGNELAELYDLEKAGASGFFDGFRNNLKSALYSVLVSYAHQLKLPLYHWPWSYSKYPGAMVNQGMVATSLGLKGFPAQMESSALQQFISELDISEGKHHFPFITTEDALKIVQKLEPNCSFSVPVHALVYNDENLTEFDENFKIMPPLRSKQQQNALVKAAVKGSITNICSNHLPVDIENKQREFTYANYGAASLQTVGSELLNAIGNNAFQEQTAQFLSHGASQILGIEPHLIQEGNNANLTIFDSNKKWVLNQKSNKSASFNYPQWDRELLGKASFSIINGILHKL